MYAYRAYGSEVASELILPELDLVTSSAPGDVGTDGDLSISISRAKVNLDRAGADVDGPICWVAAGDVCLRYPSVGSFHITGGRSIVVDITEGADERVVRLFLLGSALAVLLHQRGLLVLHASGVRINGRAAIFVGDKGRGKSTLAATLVGRGHSLIADDVIPVDLSDRERICVLPGFPQIKLTPVAAEQLGHRPGDLKPLDESAAKLAAKAGDRFARGRQWLSRIFVLQVGDRHDVVPLAPQQRFVELVRHSYLAPILGSTGEGAAHFSQVVMLASSVPVVELRREWDLGKLQEVADLVESEMSCRDDEVEASAASVVK